VVSALATQTLGIDLASQAKKTAACILEWTPTAARIVELGDGFDDEALDELANRHQITKVGIDAPFGWPRPYVSAITEYATTDRWPAIERRQLTLRTTDHNVWELTGRQPLSVSADRIAHTAFRCAELLTKLAAGKAVDRTGAGLVAEVYPAAALSHWGLTSRGYKGAGRAPARAKLLAELQGACSPWLKISAGQEARLVGSDHLLDAFVSALVARALETGSCLPIPTEHLASARAEGWIHLPARPLRELVSMASVGLP
jgi:predicted nuclease with RNAse H fold